MKDYDLAIRPLTASELRSMIDLWRRSDLSYKPKGRDAIRSLRTQRNSAPELFLGAFINARLVGAVIASDDGRRGWINRLAVLPDARKRGIAQALIKAAEDVLRRRGRRLFCIHVGSENEPSMMLFEKAGYTREKDIFYFTKRERKSY